MSPKSAGRIRVGTSGWSYDHWEGVFYPDTVPSTGRLRNYAGRFSTVEVNATFYRLPTEHAVELWGSEVPEHFAFAVKGSRFITHYRKLRDAEDPAGTFLDRVGLIGSKLEVVLWQLPPTSPRDPELLDTFLSGLPKRGPRHAVEFRNRSWLDEEVFAVLSAHGAAQVHVSSDKMPRELTPTSDFVYVRFHGTSEYHGAYRGESLEPWADFLREQAAAGLDGYAYFNNDAEGHAPKDAARLVAMLGEDARAPEAAVATG
jgi:uncharacterized protein YecE (DUF72 family)